MWLGKVLSPWCAFVVGVALLPIVSPPVGGGLAFAEPNKPHSTQERLIDGAEWPTPTPQSPIVQAQQDAAERAQRLAEHSAGSGSITQSIQRQAQAPGVLATLDVIDGVVGIDAIERSEAGGWVAARIKHSAQSYSYAYKNTRTDPDGPWSIIPAERYPFDIDDSGEIYEARFRSDRGAFSIHNPETGWRSTTETYCGANAYGTRAVAISVSAGQAIMASADRGCLFRLDPGGDTEYVGRLKNVENVELFGDYATFFVGPTQGCAAAYYGATRYYGGYALFDVDDNTLVPAEAVPIGCESQVFGSTEDGRAFIASTPSFDVDQRTGLELAVSGNAKNWVVEAAAEPLPLLLGAPVAPITFGLDSNGDLATHAAWTTPQRTTVRRSGRSFGTSSADGYTPGAQLGVVEASLPLVADHVALAPRTRRSQPDETLASFLGFVLVGDQLSELQVESWSLVEPPLPTSVEVASGFSAELSNVVDLATSPSGQWTALIADQSDGEQRVFRRDPSGAIVDLGAIPDSRRVGVLDSGVVTVLSERALTGFGCPQVVQQYWFTDQWLGPNHVKWCNGGPLTSYVAAGPDGPAGTGLLMPFASEPIYQAGGLLIADNAKTWAQTDTAPAVTSGHAAIQGFLAHFYDADQLSRVNLTTSGIDEFALPTSSVADVVVDPNDAAVLWALSLEPGALTIHKSLDFGESWTLVEQDITWPGTPASSKVVFGPDGMLHTYDARTCASTSFLSRWKRDLAPGSSWSPGETLWSNPTSRSSPTRLIDVPARPNGLVDSLQTAFAQLGDQVVAFPTSFDSVGGALGLNAYGASDGAVDVGLGNFRWQATDAGLQTPGTPLVLERSYNSADTRTGMFGLGWSTPFEMTALTNCATGGVTVSYPDGRREDHPRVVGEDFLAPIGYGSRLEGAGADTYVLSQVDGTTHEFAASSGRLQSTTDPIGFEQKLTWAGGLLESVSDVTSGRRLSFAHTDGLVTGVVTSPVTVDGVETTPTWSFGYVDGHLERSCKATNPSLLDGDCVLYSVVGDRIVRVTDENGNIDANVGYTSSGRVGWQETGEGERTIYERLPDRTTVTTDPRGNAITVHYDSRYRQTRMVDAEGGIVSYGYDEATGFATSVTDGLGLVTTRTFNDRGQVTSETNPAGETSWAEYDSLGNMVAARDARSEGPTDNRYASTQVWDAAGRLPLVVRDAATAEVADGAPVTLAYTDGTEPAIGGGVMPPGLARTRTGPAGDVTRLDYDARGNVRVMTAPLGARTEYDVDQHGRVLVERVVSDAVPGGASTTYAYDALGRIVRVDQPASDNAVTGRAQQLRTETTFDDAGNVVSTLQYDLASAADARVPRQTVSVFDRADRLVERTYLGVGTERYGYDAAGNMNETVDGRGIVSRTEFDGVNQPTRVYYPADPATGRPEETVWEREYDDAGRLVAEIDGLGRRVELVYDDASRLLREVLANFEDEVGVRDVVLVSYGYDAAGHLTSTEQGDGLLRQEVRVDEVGRPVEVVIDPLGLNHRLASSYDAFGRLASQSISDGARTEETRWEYDSVGNVVTQTVENGADDIVERFAYDDRGLLIQSSDPRQAEDGAGPGEFVSNTDYDAVGRPVRSSAPAVTTYMDGLTETEVRPATVTGYNAFGEVTHTVDERGNTTVSVFDQAGRVVLIERPSVHTSGGLAVPSLESIAYDQVGNPIEVVDAIGAVSTRVFDHRGRLVEQLDAEIGGVRGSSSWEYDVEGNLLGVVDQTGARSEFIYDSRNRITASTAVVRTASDPRRYTSTFGYDDLGNRTSTTTPLGHTTQSRFNAKSELVESIDATGRSTELEVDLRGRVTAVTDPLGRVDATEFDLAGRPVAQTRLNRNGSELGTSVSEFDAAGNLVRSVKPQGAVTATGDDYETLFEFDALNRLTATTERISARRVMTSSFGHDAAGNLTRIVDGRGHVTTMSYNAWNQVRELIEPSTSLHPDLDDRRWTTEYDVRGLPIAEVQPGGTVLTRTYDALQRPTSVVGTDATAGTADTSYGYDLAGRVTSAASGTHSMTFGYDDRSLLRVVNADGDVSRLFYDRSGRLRRSTDAVGESRYTWTPRDDLRSFTDPVSGGVARYFYNAAGQPVRTELPDGGRREVRYDSYGRIKTDQVFDVADVETAAIAYRFNRNGSLIEKTVSASGNSAAGTNQYRYDQAMRLVEWTDGADESTTYRWDDAGNRIRQDDVRSNFDARNRLRSTSDGDRYRYSERGDLVWERVDGSVTRSGFDPLGRLLGSGGNAFVYDGLNRLVSMGAAEISYSGQGLDPVAVGGELFGRLPGGQLVTASTGDGDSTWWLSDRHRDAGLGVSGAGSLAATQVFDPFGNSLEVTGDGISAGFQGDIVDPVTGLVWMGARWYSPDRGGFVSRDAFAGVVSDPLTLNRYSYTSGDPLGQWDPSGFEAESLAGGLFGGVDGRVQRLTIDGIRSAATTGVSSGGSGRTVINQPTVVVPAFSPPMVSRGFVRGVFDAVVSLPKLAIAAGADLGNCLADKAFVDTGAGCVDSLRSEIGTVMAAVTDPKAMLDACAADLGYCVGGMVGGLAAGNVRSGFGPSVAAMSGLRRVASATTRGARSVGQSVVARVGRVASTVQPRLAAVGRALTPNSNRARVAPQSTTVYRGTSNVSELAVHSDTGRLMSDAARSGYIESGGSLSAARGASSGAHSSGIDAWGSESAYAQAHGAFGIELSQIGPRSMVSVTTDPSIAKFFAGADGRVFTASVDPATLIRQTLPGAGESEFLVRHMLEAN